MKIRIHFLFLMVAVSGCAASNASRRISSKQLSSLLEEGNLHCQRGSMKTSVPYLFLKKHGANDFELRYQRLVGHTQKSSPSCKEQDNGFTCFLGSNDIFRVDYAFERTISHEENNVGATTMYINGKFRGFDDLVCYVSQADSKEMFDD